MGLMPFKNEPFTDYSNEANRKAQEDAIKRVRKEWLGLDHPLYIGGKEVKTGKFLERWNPGKTDELVGRIHMGGQKHAGMAVDAAVKAFESWRKVPAAARARYLLRAAQVIRKNKFDWNAFLMFEAGKSWPEADGDIAEAIDFLEFYARRMMEIDQPHPTSPWPGEENNVYWMPMGVGLSIPPWNFPLAIAVGMTTAMMVAGNPVVLKANSKSPIIAALIGKLFRELDLPPGVLNVVAGPASEIGDYLVDHPKVRLVSFTGSKQVGCRIYERAAKVNPGQRWLKRVVAEMGGKDAILVDESADLEKAAEAIVVAAFGYQGQKCSACSRA
ncbi:MAG: aldehyde dehydrogenase family protein, partial [Planctomycetes bacterium]|nr:aldehyde dehydrogenase family protein [Planctomycetota bacterium]